MKKLWETIVKEWNSLNAKQKKGLLVLLAVVAVISFALAKSTGKDEKPAGEQASAVSVVATNIKQQTFQRYVEVQANLESKNFALVSPRIAGTIEKFFVDEGNSVAANVTKLFQTDDIKLQQAVEIQKNLLEIANKEKQQASANLEKAQADFDKAELDFNRLKRLYEKKLVTADAFEQQQSLYKQVKAALKAVKAGVELSQANVEKVKADLAIAQKNMSDAVIYAPISGKVSERFKEPGEMAEPGKPAMRIDDTNTIEVSAYLPEQYYRQVIQGQTKIEVTVSGQKLGAYETYYKSPTINPKLRTFEVKCLLENRQQKIAAGAMAQIKVILETKQALAVPNECILQRNNKSIVFIIQNGRAKSVEVEKGIENDGFTEVVSDALTAGSMVVTMGQVMLDDGKNVSVQLEKN